MAIRVPGRVPRGRSNSRRVGLAAAVVGGVLIYVAVAYALVLRPAATTPHQDSGSDASQGRGVSGIVVAHEEHEEGTRQLAIVPPRMEDSPSLPRALSVQIPLTNGQLLLLMEHKITWEQGESMCSSRGAQLCSGSRELCQVVQHGITDPNVTVATESTKIAVPDDEMTKLREDLDDLDERWIPVRTKTSSKRNTHMWVDLRCGLSQWPADHAHSAFLACCPLSPPPPAPLVGPGPAPRSEVASVEETPPKRLSQGEVAYESSDYLKQKEEEAARIISAAYEDIDRIIKRATLSPEDLKQFSAEILVKHKADMEIQEVSQRGLDWVRAYRRRIPIREEESWATRMIQAAEMEAVRLRGSAQAEYKAYKDKDMGKTNVEAEKYKAGLERMHESRIARHRPLKRPKHRRDKTGEQGEV